MEYSFERLMIWRECRLFVKEVYFLTKKLPKEELYGLINQIRRAAISVSANFVEGNNRVSPKDQARFYEISFASLMEVYSELVMAADVGYNITIDDISNIKDRIDSVASLLSGLRNKCLERIANEKSNYV